MVLSCKNAETTRGFWHFGWRWFVIKLGLAKEKTVMAQTGARNPTLSLVLIVISVVFPRTYAIFTAGTAPLET